MKKQRIAIFGSGKGTNAEKIIQHFSAHNKIEIGLIVSSKANAGICEVALKNNLTLLVVSKNELNDSNLLKKLAYFGIGWIVLAGFLQLIPKPLIVQFPNKVLNLHPALLPKFGGKGMYGKHVHQAVVDAKETKTGITIHFVNEHFDEGEILFQAECEVTENDSIESVAQKVQRLEHEYYPKTIEQVIINS